MTIAKLISAKKKVMKLWRAACAADNISPVAKFVVFSDNNPYNADYNLAMGQYMRLRRYATSAQLDRLDQERF